MKRIIALLILMFGVTIYSFAQLRGGVKGGLNYSDLIVTSTVDSLDNSNLRSKAGYNFGCFVNVPFSENLGMQVDMLLSNKGYRKESDGATYNESLNYINWPVMFYYRPTQKLDIEIGPEFGLLITADDIIKSFDLGIDVGVRYYISELFDVALRYNMGLPFGFKSQKSYLGDISGTYANSTFQLTVGFNLFRKKSVESSGE